MMSRTLGLQQPTRMHTRPGSSSSSGGGQRSHVHRQCQRLQQPGSVVAVRTRSNRCHSWRVHAASSPPAAAAAVRYEVDGCTFSVGLKPPAHTSSSSSGSSGAPPHQQQLGLLRLQEAAADAEYVLLLPCSMASILCDVLHRAVSCVDDNTAGQHALELHHHVLHGSRRFSCSLSYTPAAGSSSSSGSGSQLPCVQVTVQEAGRSCVHLPVSKAVLPAIQQVLHLLQQVAVAGAAADVTAANGVLNTPLLTPTATAAGPAAAPAAAAVTPQAPEAGVAPAHSNGSSSSSSSNGNSATKAAAAAPGAVLQAAADASASAAPAPQSPRAAVATRRDSAGAAAAPRARIAVVPDVAAGGAPAAGVAAPGGASAAASPTAPGRAPPEVLFAAIQESSSLQEGLKFAHAATAEAISNGGSGSGSGGGSSVFQPAHLCLLWQRMPAYAADMQRQVLQLEPDVPDADVLTGTPLYHAVLRELQAFATILCPLLQPHLGVLPRHVLQRVLRAAHQAQVQLPGGFLAAWAAAAAGSSACGDWEEPGMQPWLDITQQLAAAAQPSQEQDGEQQQLHQSHAQVHVVLPLQWAAAALQHAGSRLHQQVLLEVMQGADMPWDQGQQQELQQAAASAAADLQVLQQLLPMLLAAVGLALDQQQLLWQSWNSHAASTSSNSGQVMQASEHLPAIAGVLSQMLCSGSQLRLQLQQQNLLQEQPLDVLQSQQALQTQLQQRMQQLVLGQVVALPAQQRSDATLLVWAWLAAGRGAAQLSSQDLALLLNTLPYADSEARPHSSSSLLAEVLCSHNPGCLAPGSSREGATHGASLAAEVAGVADLLSLALRQDMRAAFAAMPRLLTMLAAAPATAPHSPADVGWDAALQRVSNQVQHMLELDAQQLLKHAPDVIRALGRLSCCAGATRQGVLSVVQLTQQLAAAARSWSELSGGAALPGKQQQEEVDGVPTAASLVCCCFEAAPAWAAMAAAGAAGQATAAGRGGDVPWLPWLSELLGAAADLSDRHLHSSTSGLQPTWVSAAGAVAGSSSSDSEWQAFEPLLLSAAKGSNSTAVDSADVAAAAAALLLLGLHPSPELLQAYLGAVGPDALGLTAPGLCQLLWALAGMAAHQHGSALASGGNHGGASSSGGGDSGDRTYGSMPRLLQLSSKACSSLAVRNVSAVTPRQLARVTWALAALSSAASAGGGGAAWSPPQQMLAWLQRSWKRLAAGDGSSSSSTGLALADQVQQLQERGVLQAAEASDVLCSLKQLGLLPAQQPQQEQQPAAVKDADQSAPAAEPGSTEQPLPVAGQKRAESASIGAAQLPGQAAAAAAAAMEPLDALAVGADHPASAPPAISAVLTAEDGMDNNTALGVPDSVEAADETQQQEQPQEQQQEEEEREHHLQPQQQEEDQQPLPPSVADVLQQLRGDSFSPTQKQALQLLLPVQPQVQALPAADVLSYMQACFKHKVPVPGELLTAGAAAAAAHAAAGQEVSPHLLLRLLSATAESVMAEASRRSGQQGAQSAAAQGVSSAPAGALQQLQPLLGPDSLAGLSAGELLQLLRDVHTLMAGGPPPKATALSIGSVLFGTAAVGTTGAGVAAGGAAVDVAWLGAIAAALQPRLLLLPHGSQVLQSLQLLQALGLQQPGSTFMASFLAAADVLLDTLSGGSCLELLAACAVAGQMPPPHQVAAILQHLVPLRLAPSSVAAGCRLLAALSIRPPPDLLVRWFSITEAAAERLDPVHTQQVLWACCVWQVLPPSAWLHAVLKGLAPAGRLSSCLPPTLAGLCRSLWQLGVTPAPGFVAAVVAAAQHGLESAQRQQQGASNVHGWQQWQQGGDTDAGPGEQQGWAHDGESLSVLCFCLGMWQHPSTPAWEAAVTRQAAAVMPGVDGPSLLRLAVYLGLCLPAMSAQQQQQDADCEEEEEQLLPWQQALLEAAPALLPSSEQEAQLGLVQTAGGFLRLLPPWGLVSLTQVLAGVPDSSLPLLRAFAAAVRAEAQLERLTAWDLGALLPGFTELIEALGQEAMSVRGPMAPLLVQQLEQEAQQLLEAAQGLVKQAYQQRGGAPSVAMAMVPVLAEAFGMDMPQQSMANLQADAAAAQQRERQLEQALKLQGQGGPAVPEPLLQGLDELALGDGMLAIQQYADNPAAAAFTRRVRWLGAAVSDAWLLASLSGT